MALRSRLLLFALIATTPLLAADTPQTGVAEILARHDRSLVHELLDYTTKNPKATDIDLAYQSLFSKVIDHDWFIAHEEVAKKYLAERPDGGVRPLAMIITTMARAQAGSYADALNSYKILVAGLAGPDQEEFAVNFSDTLAVAATGAGEHAVAREVYETLKKHYADNPTLVKKIEDDLARLDKIGKPAPKFVVKDLGESMLRLDDLKGKYVLVDFWATWCAPCIAEMPRLQAAYTKYHPKGLEIVAVSMDETRQAAVDFAKSRKIPWRQVHNASSSGDMADSFGVSNIPATFLIGPDGTILRLELRGQALDDTLAKLIK